MFKSGKKWLILTSEQHKIKFIVVHFDS